MPNEALHCFTAETIVGGVAIFFFSLHSLLLSICRFPQHEIIKAFHFIPFLVLQYEPDCRDPSALPPQVHGDKDPDGFYRGECGGRLGFVPCNMVSEIQVDDEETRQQLLLQGFLSTAAASMEKIGRFTAGSLPPPREPLLHADGLMAM